MKKIALLLLVIVLLNPLFADDTTLRFITKNITIQGAFGEVAKIAVDPVPAMANSFMHGMPFNIEEPYVWFGYGEGRLIAYWSYISNSNFSIEIEAEPMRYEGESAKDIEPLTYILKFSSIPSYINSAGESISNTPYSFNVPVNSTTSNTIYKWTELENITRQDGTYIGAVNGSIYFQFDETATNRIKSNDNLNKNNTADLPSGSYSANVTLRMITKN